jgi:hypothetical protein
MNKVNTAVITLCLLGALPMAASAQNGPDQGDREFSLSGTGSSDQSFDSGSFGVTGDLGWYLRDNMVVGVRQSINYASIQGESIKDDFWNFFNSSNDATDAFQDDGAWAYTVGLGYNF